MKLSEQLISYVERNPQKILDITHETPSSGSLIYKKHLTEISTWVAHEIDELMAESGYAGFKDLLTDKYPAHSEIIDMYFDSMMSDADDVNFLTLEKSQS